MLTYKVNIGLRSIKPKEWELSINLKIKEYYLKVIILLALLPLLLLRQEPRGQELDMDMKNNLIENRISSGSSFAKPTKNAKLLWVYNVNNNKLVNNMPFTSIISAGLRN